MINKHHAYNYVVLNKVLPEILSRGLYRCRSLNMEWLKTRKGEYNLLLDVLEITAILVRKKNQQQAENYAK